MYFIFIIKQVREKIMLMRGTKNTFIVLYALEKSVYKWTHTFQTCVVPGSPVSYSIWYERTSGFKGRQRAEHRGVTTMLSSFGFTKGNRETLIECLR